MQNKVVKVVNALFYLTVVFAECLLRGLFSDNIFIIKFD
jgi:hypothetical protein